MFTVGAALLVFKPHRLFFCEAGGGKVASCRISERVLGLFPVRAEIVGAIATTETSTETTTHESRQSDGRRRTTTTRIGELSFIDAQGATQWSASDSHLVGATMDRVAGRVDELISGESLSPIVLIQAVWPALLAGTLFGVIGASGLGSALGLLLRDRGLIPEHAYRSVFYWGTLLIPTLLAAAAWVIALLGSDPPGWLGALLGSA